MEWWIWILFGLALLALELLVAGSFILFFFGLAAVLVGTMVALGFLPEMSVQWLLFSVFSIATLVALRKPLKARFTVDKNYQVDSMTEESAIAQDAIPIEGTGQVEFRGSPWSAKNVSGVPITKGQRCHVDRIQGLTLFIRPE